MTTEELAVRAPTAVSIRHRVTRLEFDSGQPYEKFRARYEVAVPALDPRSLDTPTGRYTRIQQVSGEAPGRARMVSSCTGVLTAHR
jgi:hypothetical protein